MERALIEKRVKEGLTTAQNENITPEQMNQLIDLNIEYETFKGSNTPDGNRNAKKVDEQIKQITDAIQEPSTETIPVSEQPETSPAVGTGDAQGAITTGEITSEETQTTQPTEEVTAKVEDDASEVVVIDSKDKKLEKAGLQVSNNEKSEFLQDIKDRGLEDSNFSFEVNEINEAPLITIEGIEGTSFAEESFEGGPTADITVTYTNPDGTTESFDSTVALEPFVETEQVTQQFDSPFAYKTTPTQEERLIELTQKRGELTASEAAEELQILEPNIRRIFGQGAKTGKFERVGRGVYRITTPDNKSYGVIETANAISTLKRLVKEKVKFDFIYLDPPYKSQGGKRNTGKFENFITKQDFAEVASLVGKLVRNKNTPVVFQYPVTKFTQEGSQRRKEEASFLKSLKNAGFDIAADFAPIELVKLDKQGKERFHMRGRTLRENVFFLTKSGGIGDIPLDFTETEGIRELRYPQVDTRSKEFKRFDGRTRKNIDFMINLVESLTVPGAQVLDPFAGTGTTIQAAIATGRDAIGIEIEESTADIARKEIEKTTPKQKTKPKPKPEPKKTLQKEASKKVKQTPPPKPKGKKTKDSSSEIDKTLAEFDKPMSKITPKILQLSFGNVYAQAKKFFGRLPRGVTNVVQEQLRSIPTPKIDFILGNYNSTLFYRKFFLPLVKSYQQYADKFGQKEQIIQNAEAKLLKEAKGNNNKKVINSYKIAIAQKALIHESNPDSDVTPPVLVLLNRTIQLAEDGDILSSLAAKELTKLRDTYLKDGGITFQNVYNSLTPTQKDVFKTLQEENKKLEPFAERAARRRGDTFQKLNDYSHRIVLEDNEKEIDILKNNANDYADPNTKAANTLNRQPNAKPAVSFDPFLSSLRATQEVYLDYYMSPDVSKVQQLSDAFVKKYSNGNKGQIAASKAIDKTIKELLRVTYLRSFVNTSGRTSFLTTAKRWGYRLLLGSAPRFLAELAGNSTMLLTEDPIVIKNAVGKYGKFSMKIGGDANNKFINFLTELKSGETTKLGGKLKGDSKYSDRSGILNIDSSNRGLYNPILNKMEQLSKIPKLITYDVTAYVSDILMAGGDRFIARPLWVSKFANEFKKNVKKYLNEDIELSLEDLNEISNGTSKYLTNNKFKKALQEAVIESDRTTINITTSSNPFNAITKMVKRNDAADYYRTINSFMANFTLNEYATARFAINAMFRSGELSKKQASLLMTGVLARMSSYVLIYGLLADLLDEELFDAPADDDEDLDLLLYRQMIGSVMTLMFRQNLGNITSLPINLGIEELNKKYLDGLRDGKPYDSYDNSIVYSLITLDRLDKGLDEQIVPILSGPYVEYYKTARRAIELYNRTKTRKTKKARDRAMKELEEIILLQVQGQLGLLPFYKDIIRAKRKKFYDENYKKSSGKSQGGIQRRD